MAQINDIINELETIATAFDAVNTFEFNEIEYINDNRKKSYPVILADSRNIDINPVSFNRSNLPHKTTYTLKLFFLDTYLTSEQKTTTKQDKYSELETIANQFLAEIKRRTEEDSSKGFHLQSSNVNNGFVVDEVHNDKLVQYTISVNFTAYNDCNTGNFVY